MSSSSTRLPQELSAAIEDLIDQSLLCTYPQLNETPHFVHTNGEAFQKYGDDYMCSNVLTVCTKLRAKDPKIFLEKSSEDIAKTIVKKFPKSGMIPHVSIRCGGFLTFKLSWEWMAKRIHNMLETGIKTWAPSFPDLTRAAILVPESGIGSDVHADAIRGRCIQQMIEMSLMYSGVEVYEVQKRILLVGHRQSIAKAREQVEKLFLIEQGMFKKKSGGMGEPPLFVAAETKERVSTENEIAFKDLVNLWLAIYLYRADHIVFVAPVRREGYIKRCFEAARDVQWLNDDGAFYYGYRTSSNEKQKLACLLHEFWNYSKLASLVELGNGAGYETPEEVFVFALKYAYLKNDRLVEFPLSIDELFEEKGNTFVHLLHTQALVRSIIKNPCRGTHKFTKALAAKEHELASHLVWFTEVVREACTYTMPNMLCEYLYDMSKKFTSCYGEVRPTETRLVLCRATLVVMQKCFHLLRINPNCPDGGIFEYFDEAPKIVNPFTPWSRSDKDSDARLNLNPRIELLSMFVSISADIQEIDLCGTVALSDLCGLQTGWSKSDNKKYGSVEYFFREFCNPKAIYNGSYIFFGNPSSPKAMSFGSSIEIYTNLVATSKKGARKDAFHLPYGTTEIDTSTFWDAKETRTKCDAEAFGCENGFLQIHYILLKDAVDTTLEVTFESPDPKGLQVRGHIFATYGESVLKELPDPQRMFYRASIFTTGGTWVFPGNKLQLNRSILAVPADGELVLETLMEDCKSGEILVDEKVTYTLVTNEGFERRWWKMQVLVKKDGKKGKGKKASSFNLKLEWSKDVLGAKILC